MERRAAQHGFDTFGAVLHAEEAGRRADGGDPAPPDAPPPSSEALREVEPNVFRCDGDTREIQFDGTTVLLHDLKGLRYLERLLTEPNREFHMVDLVAVERESLPTVPTMKDRETGDLATSDGGHAGLHLDNQAREAYRRRLFVVDVSSTSTTTSQTRRGRTISHVSNSPRTTATTSFEN